MPLKGVCRPHFFIKGQGVLYTGLKYFTQMNGMESEFLKMITPFMCGNPWRMQQFVISCWPTIQLGLDWFCWWPCASAFCPHVHGSLAAVAGLSFSLWTPTGVLISYAYLQPVVHVLSLLWLWGIWRSWCVILCLAGDRNHSSNNLDSLFSACFYIWLWSVFWE